MEKRRSDLEISEESARAAVVRHVRDCPVCARNHDPCADFLHVTQRWGRSLRVLDQERRAIAGCS